MKKNNINYMLIPSRYDELYVLNFKKIKKILF
jgi:hypothetical protein